MILWILQPQFVGNFVNSIIPMKLKFAVSWAEIYDYSLKI